jgi:hypothetical protein
MNEVQVLQAYSGNVIATPHTKIFCLGTMKEINCLVGDIKTLKLILCKEGVKLWM